MYEITREKPQDLTAIEHLLEISFGEERFRKTAYAIRQNSTPMVFHVHLEVNSMTTHRYPQRQYPILQPQ